MSLYKSLIFYLIFSFKFINFSFQIFLLFVPEMSTGIAMKVKGKGKVDPGILHEGPDGE